MSIAPCIAKCWTTFSCLDKSVLILQTTCCSLEQKLWVTLLLDQISFCCLVFFPPLLTVLMKANCFAGAITSGGEISHTHTRTLTHSLTHTHTHCHSQMHYFGESRWEAASLFSSSHDIMSALAAASQMKPSSGSTKSKFWPCWSSIMQKKPGLKEVHRRANTSFIQKARGAALSCLIKFK